MRASQGRQIEGGPGTEDQVLGPCCEVGVDVAQKVGIAVRISGAELGLFGVHSLAAAASRDHLSNDAPCRQPLQGASSGSSGLPPRPTSQATSARRPPATCAQSRSSTPAGSRRRRSGRLRASSRST